MTELRVTLPETALSAIHEAYRHTRHCHRCRLAALADGEGADCRTGLRLAARAIERVVAGPDGVPALASIHWREDLA